ncbi:MAG: epoxyqueuosine reductase QueH [Candidatus Aminicenantes bacterium]|nr:epoxyqueuosine reductase QueH [Candidatus Aminicenantes bacterium]
MSATGLLLHICCAPDAAYVAPLLTPDYKVTGFFYNPNIDHEAEYLLRLEETRRVAPAAGFVLEDGPYEPDRFEAMARPWAGEPEKGRRCAICYAMRLDRTARRAVDLGLPVFATVMSISPWKDAALLNRIGTRLGRKYGLRFLEADFKKKDGFRKSVEVSRRLGLYRQDYCGCRFSRRPERPARESKP